MCAWGSLIMYEVGGVKERGRWQMENQCVCVREGESARTEKRREQRGRERDRESEGEENGEWKRGIDCSVFVVLSRLSRHPGFVFAVFCLVSWMLKDWWGWTHNTVTQHYCSPGRKSCTDRGTDTRLHTCCVCVCVIVEGGMKRSVFCFYFLSRSRV